VQLARDPSAAEERQAAQLTQPVAEAKLSFAGHC